MAPAACRAAVARARARLGTFEWPTRVSRAVVVNERAMSGLRSDAVAKLFVGEESAGQRIDNYLTRLLKGVPKSHIYRILRSGEVRLNGKRVGPDARLAAGDTVRVPPVRTAEVVPKGSAGLAQQIPVVFEDEDLIVVDKPAGVAVHGGSGIAHGLIESLRAARPQARFLELAHRLDRETSGLLMVAKRRPALTELHRQLRDGEVDKRYLVLVRGYWRDEKRTVRLALHKFASREGERRVRVDDDLGRDAATTFRRIRTWRDHDPPLSLLEAELLTGRTHQIRVHLAHLGFPLAGDDKYGDFAWNRELGKAGLKRMFLHAACLTFAHPVSGASTTLEASLPPELERYLTSLTKAEARVD